MWGCQLKRAASLPVRGFQAPQDFSLAKRLFSDLSQVGKPRLRVAVAGGGICGCLLASQLARTPGLAVVVYERRVQGELPPGLNLLVSHNGMSALSDLDSQLARQLQRKGWSTPGWKARTMTGEELYNIPDVISEKLADGPGLMARWYDVADTMVAACEESGAKIIWNTCVKDYEYIATGESSRLRLTLHDNSADVTWVEGDVDLLISCDGRFSKVRHIVEGKALEPSFGPPSIADFRLVVPDTTGGLIGELDRIYNTPCSSIMSNIKYAHLAADSVFMDVCMAGLVRVGIGRVQASRHKKLDDGPLIGIFGNICMPDGGMPIPEAAKTSDGLRALFTPPEGEAALDEVGSFVLESLTSHASKIHWNRKQEVPACYRDTAGQVLLLGDSAGGFYPSLAQGATMAIEDACAAAAVLRSVMSSHGRGGIDVPAVTRLVQHLREPRRAMVASVSRLHAEHVGAGGRAALEKEAADWLGLEGGSMMPKGTWRKLLSQVWSGWPRQSDCAEQAQRLVALALTDQVRPNGSLPVATATPETFAPFGQLCGPTEDGEAFSTLDAQLDGLSEGIPRFYLMKLRGPRPLRFNRITHHKLVTQCLGLASNDSDFYLGVHAPTPEGVPPSLEGLRAFRVPPNTFVLLYKGTWHAGPLWGDAPQQIFYNLELHDTNLTDHTSIVLRHPGTPDGFINLELLYGTDSCQDN